MKMALSIHIDAPTSTVWDVISDIENCGDRISGIKAIEILEPASGPSILGLKWQETRAFAGRDATEVMWVTEVNEGANYVTRAESHGSVYLMNVSVEAEESGSKLTMDFDCTPVTRGAKILWALTGWMANGPMRKALKADLADLKLAAEA